MNYEYWCPGMPVPTEMPANCECFDSVLERWVESCGHPRSWNNWSRRWPVAEVKPEPKPEIEYEYYTGISNRPKTLPAGCECEWSTGRWAMELNPPNVWGWMKRRWPKPAMLRVDRTGPAERKSAEITLTPVSERIDSWDEYFYRMAELGKLKSKDRSTKCCSVIVGPANNVLSIGFNGFPRGVDDNVESRHERPEKYLYTEHGERNAFYNAAMHGIKIGGARVYLSGGGLPCADCARAVIQCGIVEIIVMDQPFQGKGGLWEASMKASEIMLKEAGVKVTLLDQNFKRKN